MNTLSGILFFSAFLPYIWAIVNNQTDPSPISWSIWAIVDTLALVAMRKTNTLNGQIVGASIGAWVITVLAVVYGKPTMGKVEWVSIIGAAAGIVLWQKTGNAVTAIVSSQIAVFVASFPTFQNAWENPKQEDPIAWSIWFLSCICVLLAIRNEKWTLANALQPLTFTTIETIMVVLVVIRPHLLL